MKDKKDMNKAGAGVKDKKDMNKAGPGVKDKKNKKNMKKLWIGLAVIGILSPLGLLASGDAWGEWGKEFFQKIIGYIPKGLSRFSDLWNAPFKDYSVSGTRDYVGYILCAFGGMLLVIVVTWILGKFLVHKNKCNDKCNEK